MPEISSKLTQRRAVGALFFMLGIYFSSWISQIPHIKEALGLNKAELGLLLFAFPIGRFVTVPFAGKLIAHLGSKKLAAFSITGSSLLLLAVGLVQQEAVLVVLLLTLGMGYNFIILSLNTLALVVEKQYGRSIMVSFHGLWSLACLIGAFLASFLYEHKVTTFQHFMLAAFLSTANVWLCLRYLPVDEATTSEKRPFFTMPDRFLLLIGSTAFCCLLCEGTLYDWSGIYYRDILKTEGSMIGLGYAAVMGAMTFGRFVSDWYVTRFGLKNTLQLSGFLVTIGLGTVVAFPYLVPATIGFMLAGIGVSSVVPLAYATAGKSTSVPPPVAIVTVSTIGFLGALIQPPLIGSVAEISSLRISFAIVACMGLGIFLLGGKIKRWK